MVGHKSIEVSVKPWVQVVELGVSWMESVSVHKSLEVFFGQFSLLVRIKTRKSVVNVEGWLSGQPLLVDLAMLVYFEVNFEDAEEGLSCSLSEELSFGDTLEMDVFMFSLGEVVGIVAVLWSNGFAEV